MLERRSTDLEIMDDLNMQGLVIHQTLQELDTINRILGGNTISLGSFKTILFKNRVSTVADLGCGSADILIEMAKIAKARDLDMVFKGVDANPHIVNYAKDHTSSWNNISISCENILDPSFRDQSFDIIHCCLFLHHFSEEELIDIFKSFRKQARVAVIINDLHRHWLAYHSIKLITRLFSKSYMVKNDAAVSVARGFVKSELQSILKEAGITNYSLKWRWAFRWQLVIRCI